MDGQDLIDLDTYVQLRRAAPQVTPVPRDVARLVVYALGEFSLAHKAHEDLNGQIYWQASLQALSEIGRLNECVASKTIGQTCTLMGLPKTHKNDGNYVAWSKSQLEILQKYFA